jgi:integrase
MAGIYAHSKSGVYRIHFWYGGKQHHKSLMTTKATKANAMKAQIEETLHDLERGRLSLPADADFWEFVKTDGKRDKKPLVRSGATLEGLFEWYFGSLPEGARATKTIKVQTIHGKHIKRLLGAKRELKAITGQVLQEMYVNKRAKENFHGQPIRAQTIEKEIDTLRMVWNRACRKKVEAVFTECPCADLDYPAKKDRPPFRTWDEIESTVARGRLAKAQTKEIWECLFLDLKQIGEFLEYIRGKKTRREYFYPLMVFVAHTGARVSECRRSQLIDFDFERNLVQIREKKKQKGTETYRWVPMSPFLRETMRTWLTHHPGGNFTFCRFADKKFHEQTLQDDFEWFVKGSKWEVLRGFHVFRHSFASNLARAGVSDRVIDKVMGHQTEAMRRRYQHLFPEETENAIRMLCG